MHVADDETRELPQAGGDEPAAPAGAPAAAPATGVRGMLSTRRGRTTGFAALGVLLLAAVVAITWGLVGGDSPRSQDAASAAGLTTQSTTPPAATSRAAPATHPAAATSASPAITAAGPTTTVPPAPTTAAAPAAGAGGAGAAGGGTGAGAGAPWCTSNCTATTPQRAMELAVMALQANDMDAYRSVTIDMDPADLRAAMAKGALTVRSCNVDSGDADCTATFGATLFDFSAS